MYKLPLTLTVATLIAAAAFAADAKSGLNDEGFVTTWLLLAPIPFGDSPSGAEALDKQQIQGESQLKPVAGDKVKVGDKELTWKAYQAKEHFFDFNDSLGAQTEDSIGYAVCYIQANADRDDAKLKVGSDDQCKVYLNGKQVIKNDQARPLEKDQNTADAPLKKGVNVLVFKVVNEKMDWSGCARFTDKDGQPLKGLKASTSP